ncbi:E3 ubiquitin-protein ligase aip2, partial [Globisporangium splendens]
MDLAIRVNVRYAAPPNSQIKDALRLFKSPRWVQSIIRYIMPQLNSVSPAAVHVIEALKQRLVACDSSSSCVVCMEAMRGQCVELPCRHQFHEHCIEPWLKMHSTCPTCRHQLPTDAYTNYSVYAINTTIILQQSQARMPTAELLELPAGNQIIRAIVNARVRRNAPVDPATASSVSQMPSINSSSPIPADLPLLHADAPVMNASVLQRGAELSATLPCITEPVVPVLQRNSARRRCREEDGAQVTHKRARLSDSVEEQDISTSV